MAKYQAIADDLAGRLARGEWRPGQALPSQRDLAVAYGVTLMTLRQALSALEERGLLTQRPGRGTFAGPPPAAYRLESLRSLADELRAQGREVVTQVRAVGLRA